MTRAITRGGGHRHHDAGFTLLELVLVIVLLGLLSVASVSLLSGGLNAYNAGRDSVQIVGEIRYAMARMAHELRETANSGGSYVIAPVGSAQSTVALTRADGVAVTLNANGVNLEISYSTVTGTHLLSNNLQSLVINHYQSDGVTVATDVTNVAFVEITVSLTDPAGAVISQRTRVGLRN